MHAEYHDTEWLRAMLTDIELAAASIHLTALSFQPQTPERSGAISRLWTALHAARARGVQVYAYLPTPNRNAAATMRNASTASMMRQAGMHCHLVQGGRLLHAKTLVVDALVVHIGSGNFTDAAASQNYEAYLRVISPAIASRLINRWKELP